MNFEILIAQITQAHLTLSNQAARQVNELQTIRNWLIGCYIVEFERNGEDQSVYGKNTIPLLAVQLKNAGMIGMGQRNLYTFREFYLTYPQILQTVSAKLQTIGIQSISLPMPPIDELMLPVDTLINTLSFSHFIELLRLDSDVKRRFYEAESVKNAWKVRELERAIDTLLFERTGLSTDKQGVIAKIKDNQPSGTADLIKNPYVLEFLGKVLMDFSTWAMLVL